MITRTLILRRPRSGARAFGTLTALAALLLAGCRDLPTQPGTDPAEVKAGQLAVYAAAPSSVTTLVVEVTGPGIVKAAGTPDTLVFNIAMTGGVGSGSVQVPAGPSRTFTVRAFDGVTETHRGATTADIVAGTNPAISITLIPFIGTTPITVSIGTTLVIVSPAARTLEIGDTLRLTSQVIDQNGVTLSGGVVRWASLNPVRAQVDTLGLVTMRDTGDVQIVATYGTVGGSAKLTGANHGSGLSYYLTWNGRTSQSWTDTTNWTPHGIAAARVPTGSDSVVIAASAARMPRLNGCATATARDLVVEVGASLEYGCSSTVGISVSRSAVIRGTTTAELRAQRTVVLSGRFARLVVTGDSVRLADTVLATSLLLNGTSPQLLLGGKPLTVNGAVDASQGARVALGGATMTVTGSFTLADSSWVEMTNAADTLNVRGSLDFGSRDTRTGSLLSAGVLRVGGYLYANERFSFAPSGTHQTILDGTTYQSITVDSAALNLGTWQNLAVRNRDHVAFSYYSTTSDSIALPNFQLDTAAGRVDFYYRRWGVMPAGGSLIVTDTLYSYYGTVRVTGAVTLRSRPAPAPGDPAVAKAMLSGPGAFTVSGVLITDARSIVDVNDVYLHDATGTANVSGTFSPATLHLTALQPTLKPGLPYNGLALHGTRTGVTLTGATTFAYLVTLSNGSRLVLNGNTLAVGTNLLLTDSSWVEMTNAADTLNVRGNFTAGTKDTRSGNLLSAGVVRVGGHFNATGRFSFAPSGTHQTILDGTTYQSITVDSAALNLGTWQNLAVRNRDHVAFSYYSTTSDSIALPNFQLDTAAGRVDFYYRRWGITPAGGTLTVTDTLYGYYGTVRVAGALTLRSRPAAAPGNPAVARAMLSGPGAFAVSGVFTADAPSAVDLADLYLLDASGTAAVTGAFSPAVLHLTALQPTLTPGLPYRNLDLIGTRGGVVLTGATTLTGQATLSAGSRLVLNGKTLTVSGHVTLTDSSWVEMKNAIDTLSIRGGITFGTKDTRTTSLLSAGVLRVGGHLQALNRFSFAPTGTHQTILDGVDPQSVTVDSLALNLGTWQNLTVQNRKQVSFSYYSVSNDSIALPNFTLAATAGRVTFFYRRWGITPAGGTLTVSDTLYGYGGTVRVAGNLTLNSRPPAVPGDPAVAKAILTGPAVFSISGALTSDAGAIVNPDRLELADASGTAGVNGGGTFAPATVVFAGTNQTVNTALSYRSMILTGSALTVPVGLLFDGNVESYGDLVFAGAASATGSLTVHRGGRATSSAVGYADFLNIINQEPAQGDIFASTLDNRPAAQGAGGFRYRTPGGAYYGSGGILLGPTPVAYSPFS